MKICPACQTANSPKSRFCRSCGGSLAETESTPQEAAETLAAPSETVSLETQPALEETASEPAGAADSDLPDAADSVGPEPTAEAVEQPAPPPPGEVAAEEPYVTASELPAPPAESEIDSACPIRVFLNFNRLIIANCHSTVELRIENISHLAVSNISIELESKAFDEPCEARLYRLGPAQVANRIVEIEPHRFGRFILKAHVSLATDDGDIPQSYRADRRLRVNQQPDFSGGISINIQDLQGNAGSGANANLGAEYGDVNISNIMGGIQDLNSLLDVKLPDNLEPLDLQPAEDHLFETFRAPRGSFGSMKSTANGGAGSAFAHPQGRARSPKLTIPSRFIGYKQLASQLELVPENSREASEAGLPAIRFLTQPELSLGRSRQDVDFLTWFWPLDKRGKEKTMGLSKKHITARIDAEGMPTFENHSDNGTCLNGSPMDEGVQEPLRESGILALGMDYQLRVKLAEPACEPNVLNLRSWSGGYPHASPAPSAAKFGNIHFRPVECDYALWNAIWLFSDALVGSGSDCALRLEKGPESAARIRWWQGQFWLEGLDNNAAIILDGQAIELEALYPLARGSRLEIRGEAYRIETKA